MAVAEMERRSVAKKKAGRPASENPRGEGIQVRIAPDVVRMARKVSPVDGVNLTDYLSNILRPVVLRDYARVQRMLDMDDDQAREVGGK
jgi:hypothetical protein